MPQSRSVLAIGGVLLVAITALAMLSHGFPYGVSIDETPFSFYFGIALAAGGVWAFLPRFISWQGHRNTSILAIVLIGLAMRGAMFLSLPVLEDDSYRYLWDGAVTAHGHDPYKYAPAAARSESILGVEQSGPIEQDLASLREIAEEHAEPHSRINYPYVSTIYPPLAQAAFAAAYVIEPFGLSGWRMERILPGIERRYQDSVL